MVFEKVFLSRFSLFNIVPDLNNYKIDKKNKVEVFNCFVLFFLYIAANAPNFAAIIKPTTSAMVRMMAMMPP